MRAIRVLVNEALVALEQEFAALYAPVGRLSIPPGEAVASDALASLLFHSLGAAIDGAAGVRSAVPLVRGHRRRRRGVGSLSFFSKNRERLLEGDIAAKLWSTVLAHPRVKRLLSSDHFSVDGTLIEAWASMEELHAKDGSDELPADGDGRNAEADFHSQKRSSLKPGKIEDEAARLVLQAVDLGAQAGRFPPETL
jgi:hypothetical protein